MSVCERYVVEAMADDWEWLGTRCRRRHDRGGEKEQRSILSHLSGQTPYPARLSLPSLCQDPFPEIISGGCVRLMEPLKACGRSLRQKQATVEAACVLTWSQTPPHYFFVFLFYLFYRSSWPSWATANKKLRKHLSTRSNVLHCFQSFLPSRLLSPTIQLKGHTPAGQQHNETIKRRKKKRPCGSSFCFGLFWWSFSLKGPLCHSLHKFRSNHKYLLTTTSNSKRESKRKCDESHPEVETRTQETESL